MADKVYRDYDTYFNDDGEYNVVIQETLTKTVRIKAGSQDEAIEKARDMYNNDEIELTWEDLTDVSYY